MVAEPSLIFRLFVNVTMSLFDISYVAPPLIHTFADDDEIDVIDPHRPFCVLDLVHSEII